MNEPAWKTREREIDRESDDRRERFYSYVDQAVRARNRRDFWRSVALAGLWTAFVLIVITAGILGR